MFSKSCIFCSIFILLYGIVSPSRSPKCDQSKKTNIKEGNIRETSDFPWLGVLRVHYHEGKKLQIAITGLVLIKAKYCLANAYDVGKIPKSYLKREGKATFILKDNVTWACKVKDYTTHPEYEFSTYNTVALVELDLESSEEFKEELVPICLAKENYNTNNQLYALGYTDENMLLEKVIYKIQYVKLDLCEEFYNRIGFQKYLETPTSSSYYCGFAANNKENCDWESGMVLASNASGPWVLVGFGIKSPGCAAPSRFIDISSYLPWIESVTQEIVEIYK